MSGLGGTRRFLSHREIDLKTMIKFVKSYLRCRVANLTCGSNHLFIGPPGIGKSEGVIEAAREVAKEANLHFWEYENAAEPPEGYEKTFVLVLFRLDMVKPEDLSGFPLPDKGERTFDYAIPRWAKVLRNAKAGLVILDEFTNINDDTLLSAAYDIVLSEKVNLYYFRKPVIALGNPPEMSSIARPLPLPLLNRLALHYVKEPTVDEWCNYMERKYGESWAKEVCTFLHAFTDYFLRVPEESEELTPFPTPRSWTNLAVALPNAFPELYEALQNKQESRKRELLNLVASYVGPDAALTFVNWALTNLPSVEEIVKNPSILNELSNDQLVLVAQQLATHKHPHWKARVTKVIEYMLKDPNKRRYAAMVLRFMGDEKRREYIEYLKKNKVQLLHEIKTKIGGGELFGTR